MASRMDKYHSNSSCSRSVRNKELYKDMYDNIQYSNIENVTTIEKTNEINIAQIQELLKEREQYKKRSAVPTRKTPIVEKKYEERNYDIREILNNAKSNKVDDGESRSLRNTQYNILKNININDQTIDKVERIEKTLTNTQTLRSYNDDDLSLDMLSDLKSDGDTTVLNNKTNLLKEVAEAKDKYEDNDDGLDKSFYTSSLNFNEDDFEQLKDIQDSIDNNNKMIKILFFLLIVVIIAVICFVVFKIF